MIGLTGWGKIKLGGDRNTFDMTSFLVIILFLDLNIIRNKQTKTKFWQENINRKASV